MRRSLISILVGLLAVVCALPASAGWDEGVAAFTAKNYQQAAAEFQKVVDQGADYRGHYMLGMSLQRLGRKEEALRHLRQAYDLNPNDVAVKLELGKAYLVLRRYAEVAKLLDTVDASALPGSHQAPFYQMRAQAKLQNGDERGAYQDFRQLAKLKPQDAKVQYSYGAVALKVDQIDTAIAALDQAVRLDGQDPEKKITLANALIKKGRMTQNRTEKRKTYLKAANLAEAIVKADPSFENLMLQISAELGAGRYDEAAATGRKAQAKNPNDWIVPFYIGQAYTSSGKFAEAEAPLKKALELVKTPADQKKVWKQLGFSYEKSRRFDESIAAYQNAGDSGSVARVEKNRDTAEFNQQVEAENARIKALEEEARRLEEEMKNLEEGGGGGGGR